jgi:hypothetical protein
MSGQLDHLDPGAVGERVRIVRRLSGLTGEELIRRLKSRSAALVTQLERGESRVIERISDIANACAGEWVLREATTEQIARYLSFERDEVPISWPRRVEMVRRLSGLTGIELAHRLESTSAGHTSQIAKAVAGEDFLRNIEPERIDRYLRYETNELPVKSGE